jgi:YfiH family protein
MRQVHGTVVTPVAAAGQVLPETDGIVTASSGLGLAVLVADCVPILLADPDAGVIGAVHAGRRGAAGGVALRALESMIELGATVENMAAVLGPAICGRCYEVPAPMRDEVEATLVGSATTTGKGTPGLDLRAGLARQLRDAGVADVEIDPRCTYTDPALYSHRRGAPTGRFAGLIWLAK